MNLFIVQWSHKVKVNMKTLVIMIFIISLFVVGCGYKTNPIYVSDNNTSINKTPEIKVEK